MEWERLILPAELRLFTPDPGCDSVREPDELPYCTFQDKNCRLVWMYLPRIARSNNAPKVRLTSTVCLIRGCWVLSGHDRRTVNVGNNDKGSEVVADDRDSQETNQGGWQ